MPALMPTAHNCKVIWLGKVDDSVKNIRAEALAAAMLTFEGIEGECHSGLTRASCVRVLKQYPKGTEIRNVRQLSVVSAEDLAQIAAQMKIEDCRPEWLGASIVVSGIPDFSNVPPSSRLVFQSGASIAIDMQNRPCVLPGREIEAELPGYGTAFKGAAKGRRGVTAWVERPGAIEVGDIGVLHVPDQPVWAHLAGCRS